MTSEKHQTRATWQPPVIEYVYADETLCIGVRAPNKYTLTVSIADKDKGSVEVNIPEYVLRIILGYSVPYRDDCWRLPEPMFTWSDGGPMAITVTKGYDDAALVHVKVVDTHGTFYAGVPESILDLLFTEARFPRHTVKDESSSTATAGAR